MIPMLPYEYCAFRFLELWERDEKSLHSDMQGTPSGDQIRSVLRHYRVARNFKGLSDEVAEQISEDLLEVSDGDGSYSDKVVSLAERFEENYGQFNLSAASKLLWLRNKRPYLIYDKRAATAIRLLGSEIEIGNYKSYCEAWESELKSKVTKYR
jgi:hypothetical protein